MLSCAADIFPGRVVMLDANLFDVERCCVGSPSTRSHYCVCLGVAGGRVFWVPFNSGKSPGRLPVFREEKRGHMNWVSNPKKRDSQGVSYYYPTQIWVLTPETSIMASRHDLSSLDKPNSISEGSLARMRSDCAQALIQAEGITPC